MNDTLKKSNLISELTTLAKGYMPSRIFLTALELDLFGHLGSEFLSASEMASRMRTDVRGTEIILNALVGMKILKKNEDLFSNLDSMRDLLDSDSVHYHKGGLRHIANLWSSWSCLTEVVKTGRPKQRQWTDEMSRDLANSMAENIDKVLKKNTMVLDCSNIKCLLDLGGGSGSFAITLAKLFKNMQAVIFDNDQIALAMAERDIEKLNLGKRVQVRKGNFMDDEIGKGYDTIFLSFILCLFSIKQNADLLKKVYTALEEGGRVIIRDAFLDDSLTSPVSSALFSVNMLVATHNGRSYGYDEIKGLLEKVGFKDIYRVPIVGMQLAVGRK